jgi:hypothetical protein
VRRTLLATLPAAPTLRWWRRLLPLTRSPLTHRPSLLRRPSSRSSHVARPLPAGLRCPARAPQTPCRCLPSRPPRRGSSAADALSTTSAARPTHARRPRPHPTRPHRPARFTTACQWACLHQPRRRRPPHRPARCASSSPRSAKPSGRRSPSCSLWSRRARRRARASAVSAQPPRVTLDRGRTSKRPHPQAAPERPAAPAPPLPPPSSARTIAHRPPHRPHPRRRAHRRNRRPGSRPDRCRRRHRRHSRHSRRRRRHSHRRRPHN